MIPETESQPVPIGRRSAPPVLSALLEGALLLVIVAAAYYFRMAGIGWGEYQYLHPDERFLVWVGADISPTVLEPNPADPAAAPVKRWLTVGEYFDTPNSPLNPHNRGHPLYVYGTLPMFITRVAVELIYGHSGWNEMTDVGRPLAAFADLLTLLTLYALARRLLNAKVALLASAFYAAAALPIQQSHFFTTDTFVVFFALLAVYLAVRVATDPAPHDLELGQRAAEASDPLADADAETVVAHQRPPTAGLFALLDRYRSLLFASLLFGVVLGCAVASKISVAPVAVMLPLAFVARWLQARRENRRFPLGLAAGALALAAFASLLVFRVAQPYAFSGPGFFNVIPNPQWVANIKEQQALARGDWPPSMQWARRSITFSGTNLTVWGLGLPLGLLAWVGFLAAGWRILKGKGEALWMIWLWSGAYFAWQSLQPNPTMRYQLPIYPLLALFAAWVIVAALESRREAMADRLPASGLAAALGRAGAAAARFLPALALAGGALTLAVTYAYAIGFTQIYLTPITRIEASRWIFQNIPGPVNVRVATDGGVVSQPVAIPYYQTITNGQPYRFTFTAQTSGQLAEIYLPHIREIPTAAEGAQLAVVFSAQPGGEQPLATAVVAVQALLDANSEFLLYFDQPVMLSQQQTYHLTLRLSPAGAALNLCDALKLRVSTVSGLTEQELPRLPQCVLSAEIPYFTTFTAQSDGVVGEISLPRAELPAAVSQPKTVSLSLQPAGDPAAQPRTATELLAAGDESARFTFDGVSLEKGMAYEIVLSLETSAASVNLLGAAVANEGEWDDGLPVRTDGLDGYGGIYPPGLNFNMYTDDDPVKLARFLDILDETEYIFISSNRQWGSLPRIPERFPMTSVYYRALLGCPEERDIYWCYAVAQPGMFAGDLGFELVQVFQSDPRIGNLRVNDQFAEEAFHVYDHPKVLIFQKTADYDPQRVSDILGAVDLTQVIRVSPFDAASYPANLELPAERLAGQQAGGTWSELFDTQALYNRYPLLAAVIWYATISIIGWLAYPLMRLALPGLADRGYPLARLGGMVFWVWMVWVAGSAGLPTTRWTLTAGLLILAGLGLGAAYRQRKELKTAWRANRRQFIVVELVALGFFLLDLLIRFNNPDLWHPWLGGEKPMDFAYFNAVLKSTSFPPYDPWYANGYLNYYYYGYVLVSMPVKWLGIVPAVAYNLILPTLFSLTALGAFSIGWNVWVKVAERKQAADDAPSPAVSARFPLAAGLLAAVFVTLLGNLGTVKLILQGWQRLAAPGADISSGSLFAHLQWTFEGLGKSLSGVALPLRPSDWYWLPSRAIAAPGDVEPITEFPFFTFLYGDLHAHMIALPLTLLAIAWALSTVLGQARWPGKLGYTASLLLAGLTIGALRPTNTWDFYPYLLLATLALLYALLRYGEPGKLRLLAPLPDWARRLTALVGSAALLVGLSFVLYQPFTQWFALGYSKVDPWRGTHTAIGDYFVHWGFFLFLIVSWMVWETREWMAATPLSALRKLEPYLGILLAALGIVLLWVLGLIALKLLGAENDAATVNSAIAWFLALMWLKISIAWIALPLMAWAGVLLFRPGLPDAKRFILFLIGTALALTVFVEAIVLAGDIGRMNTVFKFYLQAWVMLGLSAAAALGWLWPAVKTWLAGWRIPWRIVFAFLFFATALYPLYASLAKIQDRFTAGLPRTLDGMSYMQFVTYNNLGAELALEEDYRAIRWVQETVKGSPVIVEGAPAGVQYYWFSRFSIYTGLPTVVGWQWHQEQQRVKVPGGPVAARGQEVGEFYRTTSQSMVQTFLAKYRPQYIIVGQLERGHYRENPEGLEKFEAWDGAFWREVYRDGATVIYEVIE